MREYRVHNLSDKKFGKLTVLEFSHSYRGNAYWNCECECGKVKTVRGQSLKQGTKSCGCLNKGGIKHGMYGTPTYRSWQSMKTRCENPKVKEYRYYGDRGITVCSRWRESFQNFFADMGERPVGTTIGRIDNNGNYNPINCRWMDIVEQSNNKSSSVRIKIGTITCTMSEWSKIIGISQITIKSRLLRGWDPQRAVLTPVDIRYSCRKGVHYA